MALVRPVAHCGKALVLSCYLDTQIPDAAVRILFPRSDCPTMLTFSFMLQSLHHLYVVGQFLTPEVKDENPAF